MTKKNNYYLKSINNQIEQVYHQTKSTKAKRMPSLVVQGSYTMQDKAKYYTFDMPYGLPSEESKFIKKNYYNMFAGAQYNIYTGGAVTSLIKTKEAELNSAKFNLKEEEIKVIYKVKSLYIKILELKAIEKVSQSQVDALESHLKDIQHFYDKGLVADIDLMQTRIKLKEAIQQHSEVKKEINVLKSQLAILMGENPSYEYTVEEVNENIEEIPGFKELNEIAKKHRPLLKQLDFKIDSVAQTENLSKSSLLPKVYVKGGYQYSNSMEGVEPEGGFMLEAGVSFKLDWNKPFEDMKASKEAVYRVQNLKRNADLRISMEVKRAYENYKTAVSNHKVALSALDEAKEYFRITKLKYANGIASNTDVLDAETMLTNAKANEKKSFYNILNAYFGIESAIGTNLKGGNKDEQ